MNWFDILISIVFVYCITSGYRSGLIKQITSLAGIIVAAILSGKISELIYPIIKNIEQIPAYITMPLSFVIAFLVIITCFYIVRKMLESIVKTFKMGTLNKICGSIFCFAKWSISISIVLNVIVALDNDNKLISKNIENESKSFQYIRELAPEIVPYLKFDKLKN